MAHRFQNPPSRSSPFSNPFKKLQNPFGSAGKRSLDLGSIQSNFDNNIGNNNNNNNAGSSGFGRSDRVVPSSLSANSLTSWRSKGAEMISKSWGRNRKNSEPLLKGAIGSMTTSVIFGADLVDAVRISHIPGTPLVPAVLYRCAEFLEAKGVDEVGLYRVPGSHANVQKLKRMFDTGRDFNLMTMDAIDPNDIATLLKLYLRELPSQLMTPALLEQFQSLLTTDRQICQTLRTILVRLPTPNYIVLSFLCHHLSKIAAHSDKTKMTVSNLGVVFAPTLAIGSVLFKALLGGFYDGSDTAENMELGLKIVWGGRQDNNGLQKWSEQEEEEEGGSLGWSDTSNFRKGDKEEYQDPDQDGSEDPYQEKSQASVSHQQSLPTMSPFGDSFTDTSSGPHFGHITYESIGPLDLDDRDLAEDSLSDPMTSVTLSSGALEAVADEESRLVSALLRREELALKPPPVSETIQIAFIAPLAQMTGTTLPPSHLTSTATVSSNSNTMSTPSRINGEVNQMTSHVVPSSPTAIPSSALSHGASAHNVTIDASAIPSTPAITHSASDHVPKPVSTSPPTSATGAPQLPALSRMSISL
ncbi:hypothetical protein BGZ99_000848 [Dissophora globulifera]|uniref:Rho-GAP domain-containing protein n=1 Tax=Dissophora globulifera TaxID=979702 RepID=A0A9P6UY38_9FUNG|nr:hypothetical protein BGZ99_000848 [Dissophora globulifera]